MKYKLIKIQPHFKELRWDWGIDHIDGDRQDEKTIPNPNGYYYYNESISDEVAFTRLKLAMISAHEEEIQKLKISLESLKQLRFKS